MNCTACSVPFESHASLGATLDLCRDCWETNCASFWWTAVAGLASLEDAPLVTEYDMLRIFQPDPPDENPKDRVSAGKPPLHLIPPAAEILESVVMSLGARKYGPFNWRSAKVRATVYIAAAKRHLAQWLDGDNDDSESGVSHLAHARACLGILLDAQATGNLVDDRPTPGVATRLIVQHTSDPPLVQAPEQ